MESIVLVWWLVLGGSGNAGSSWSPVPYADEQFCEDLAAEINARETRPLFYADCIPQPASDVTRFNNGIGRAVDNYRSAQ